MRRGKPAGGPRRALVRRRRHVVVVGIVVGSRLSLQSLLLLTLVRLPAEGVAFTITLLRFLLVVFIFRDREMMSS